MEQEKARIAVVGDGAWGTATAILLAKNGHKVELFSTFPEYLREMAKTRNNRKFLPGVEIPYEVEFTDTVDDLLEDSDLIVQAVPTRFLRLVMRTIAPKVKPTMPVVSLTKGIEQETHLRPSQILREELGKKTHVLSLSGPSHAEEVAVGLPASVVVAGTDVDLTTRIQNLFSCGTFRVYRSDDLVGVELGGALKNVIALAAGMCDGLGFGDNTKAALLTRGVKEMADLGTALGGKRKSFFGLAGIGDLIVTCTSRHGRNLAVGQRIGKGEKLDDILHSTEKVAEGVYTAKAVYMLAREKKLDMPICTEVYEILYNGKDPRQAVTDLMTRELKQE